MERYFFVHKWGGFGGKHGSFNFPFGIAINHNWDVYVSDFYNHRIQKFTLNGNFQLEWGQIGNADEDLMNPWGIFTFKDEVYVADAGHHCIKVFDSNGNYSRRIGNPGQGDGKLLIPTDMCMDPIYQDTFFVVDMGNNRIQAFDFNGVYKYKWGKLGTNNVEFNSPQFIAVNNKGVLYVTDTNNHRVQYFMTDGTYLGKWGQYGNNNNQFISPEGICIDSSNNVYVNEMSHQVKKFDSIGNFITSFGSPGHGDGELNNPMDIAILEAGLIKRVYAYIADSVNQRIQIYQQEVETHVLPYLPH